jgi:hypothetical protein
MSKYVKSAHETPLLTLMAGVQSGSIRLPHFQRPLVWKPGQVVALLQSVFRHHPAGSLIILDSRGEPPFEIRPFEGAPEPSASVSSLVLDGQQRLTSLYQALAGAGDYLYYIDLRLIREGLSIEDEGVIFFVKANTRSGKNYVRRIELAQLEYQRDNLIFPLGQISEDHWGRAQQWVSQVSKTIEDPIDRLAWIEELTSLYESEIAPISTYNFPVVELDSEASVEAVCVIFEDLNRQGVKLGVFDLLVARFFPQDVYLNDLWKESYEEYKVEFDRLDDSFDPVEVLKCISLLSTFSKSIQSNAEEKATASASRKAVLAVTADDVREWWEKAIDGFVEVSNLLHDECGVLTAKWLPYKPMLVPLAGLYAWRTESVSRSPFKGDARGLILRWFWSSVFSQAYEQGAAARVGIDFAALNRWIIGGDQPAAVRDFEVDRLDLRGCLAGSAVYRGMMALVASRRPKDFRNGTPLGAALLRGDVHDHHIFPKAFLSAEVSENLRNCVLNRVLIEGETNLFIGKKAPSRYLTQILENSDSTMRLSTENLEGVLDSHFLPTGPDSPLWTDDFDAFLEARESRMLELVREATSGE